MKFPRMIGAAAMTALLLAASESYATTFLTNITVTPNPIGVNDFATITIDGHYNTPGPTEIDYCFLYLVCTRKLPPTFDCGDEAIATGQGNVSIIYPPLQPFPLRWTYQFTQIGSFEIRAAAGGETHDFGWYECADRPAVSVTIDVLGDTIRSVQSITPALVNRPTSVIVKGFGSCSQHVQVDWGDGNSSTIPGPVNLNIGGVASHTYTTKARRTVQASGSVCNGTATTTIDVWESSIPPDRVISRDDVARLRQKLERFKHLPPLPPPSGGPGCPVCTRLAQRITLLDQRGRDLQMQSDMIVKDLSIDGGKGVRADNVPIVGDLTKHLEEYFMLREQLLKQYKKALAKPGPGEKQLPPQPGR